LNIRIDVHLPFQCGYEQVLTSTSIGIGRRHLIGSFWNLAETYLMSVMDWNIGM
jgi:hypothetical protein